MQLLNSELSRLRSHLEDLSPLVVQELKSTFVRTAASSPNEIAWYWLVIYPEGHFVTFGPVDRHNTSYGELFLEGLPLIPEEEFFLDLERYSGSEDIEDLFIRFCSAQSGLFFNWLSDCFMKAGGHHLSPPFIASYHNDNDYFDLKSRQWLTSEDLEAISGRKASALRA